MLIPDHLKQPCNTEVVELIENVVEKENGFKVFVISHDLELREFECYDKRFLLSLRPEPFQVATAERELIIVAVNAKAGAL